MAEKLFLGAKLRKLREARGWTLEACAERLGLSPEQVLHVGDDVDADIHGAHRAGLRSGWMHRSDAHARYPHWPEHAGFRPDLIGRLVQ